jgi:hypothetical protein
VLNPTDQVAVDPGEQMDPEDASEI